MQTGTIELKPGDFAGYEAAVAHENLVRAAACLGLTETVCGMEVLPMNIEHVRFLALADSPFLIRGISPEIICLRPKIDAEIVQALWIISPRFKAGNIRARNKFLRSKMVKRSRLAPLIGRIESVAKYVEDAYIDNPPLPPSNKSYFAYEIGVAVEMSRAFGLPIDFWNKHPLRQFMRWITGKPSPLKIPLKIVFQIRKAQRQMDVPNAILHNASDKLLADGLAALNERNRKDSENHHG